jgi:hypothetical protein
MNKPAFTEREVEELQDMNTNFGYQHGVSDVIVFLKTLGYSDVNAVVIAIRKEFSNKRIPDRQLKFQEEYKDSTLLQKLCDRMDWTKKQKEAKDE